MPSDNNSKPVDALTTIHRWSLDRPAWQRDALRRIIINGNLSESDIDDLTLLCLEPQSIAATPLAVEHFAAAVVSDNPVSVISVGNAVGVNNIAPDQVLYFQDKGINIVYGDNGAGKSGYARIFKRACRARRAGEILPNVYATHHIGPARAEISFSRGGKSEPSIIWEDSQAPHPILAQISVFDSDCAAVHLEEKNEVAFKPFGLDIPDELARACQIIKERLTRQKAIVESQKDRIFIKPIWSGSTPAGRAVQNISWGASIDNFAQLADLTDADIARLASLENDLNRDPKIAAAQQQLRVRNAQSLLKALQAADEANSDSALFNIKQAHATAVDWQRSADKAADKAFGAHHLPNTGGAVWRALWETSRSFSNAAGFDPAAFPPSAGDKCLLCQSPLDETAANHLACFHKFIETAVENQAAEARDVYNQLYRSFRRDQLEWVRISAHVREIFISNPVLAKSIRRFAAYVRLKRHLLLRSISDRSPLTTTARPRHVIEELRAYINEMEKYSRELQAAIDPSGRIRLEQEYLQLRDRKLIFENLSLISAEIRRLRDMAALEKALSTTATASVTKLGNEIADQIITPQLRDRFQGEIVKLAGDKVRVEIVRSGGKYGSPHYQIRLFALPNSNVETILSEGEQTCVAIAAFFAELATAEHRSSLVFDDPVTSLDHRWRKKVATRLIEEAADRQIIVFAHDLVFVNDLIDLARASDLSPKVMTVSRGAAGTGIVNEGLPWKAQAVPERVDNLEKRVRKAKQKYDGNDETSYASEISEIYAHLRAAWERALEDGAFSHVILRHRDYIDIKHLKKVSVLTASDCDDYALGYKKCCDVVDAHDPSRVRNAEPPSPSEALSDIAKLHDWFRSIRRRQQAL